MAKKREQAKADAPAPEKKVGRDQRYIAPNRIEQRVSQGWTRVAQVKDGPQVVLRNGSVLMEKA